MMTFSPDPAVAKKQLLAIIYYLTAFGHSDGEFDAKERRFVSDYVGKLVAERTRAAMAGADALSVSVAVEKWTAQFQRVADKIDREIAALFTESVAEGESADQYVHAALALRCFELLKSFDEAGRAQLFELVDEAVRVDGAIHPNEALLRDEIQRLLAEPEAVEPEPVAVVPPSLEVAPKVELACRTDDHPYLQHLERAYPKDAGLFASESEVDIALVHQVMTTLQEQRARGAGRLVKGGTLRDFAGQEPFLDGYVHVLPPERGKHYELIVVGDLHGCYSCLKAVLQQTDFMAKVEAHHADPDNTPDTRLIFLGDYIDRGRWAFDGVLRAAMRLFVAAPHAVYLLRGNHEYYIEYEGRILAPVRPAEAMMSLEGIATPAFFREYLKLFEALPTMLAFDRLLFVHGGIPRDQTTSERWVDLSSLNDPDIRFQMLWSDPSEAETVPAELQKASSRFAFGVKQLRHFLARIGCTTLVRGHDRIVEGFRRVYDANDATLLSLFSAGGATNADLPDTCNYREVTPMALTIRHCDGESVVTPFAIDWQRFNDPKRNGFLA
ncbi:MAG: serine/threonine protein phosphatase [Deltaproteobacteria bacterium]|nr:serine/threonine protein phosphatase [Deltaproteobacteria bacterium]